MTDKVVIITGGSRGIGRATAIAAAARGFRVVVGYATNKAAADEVISAIEAKNGKAIAVKCDVAEESDILRLFEAADEFGTLGALVNNGGIVGKSGVRVDEMSAERIQRVMAVNVTGSILCAREAVKRMSTPILNAPQSAILGMHKIQDRPVAIGGKVEIRPMMYLALSYDHRVIDGKEAVTFLVRVKEALEDPARLVLDL